MRKEPRQARSREMVERIIAAGREVLVQTGYESFSTNRVAEQAGISPGSLYQYFPDKAAILDEVIDRYWEHNAVLTERALGDRVAQITAQDTRPVIDALLSAMEADPALLRVVVEELPQARWRERRAELVRRVRELTTAAAIAFAESDDPNTSDAAWVIVIAMENLATRWVLDRPNIDRADFIEELNALVAGYIAQRSPQRPRQREATAR